MTWMRAGAVAAAVAVVVGYCWVAAGLRPFTAPEAVAVAVPEAAMAVVAWRRQPGRRQMAAAGAARAAAPWLALFGALTVWEVVAYFSAPRHEHPTLSSMADALMSTHPGRAALFATWLLLGLALCGRRAA